MKLLLIISTYALNKQKKPALSWFLKIK